MSSDEYGFGYERKENNYDSVIRELKEIENNIARRKQIAQNVRRGNYDAENDSYDLLCPDCNSHVGEFDNEDGEGVYRYNIIYRFCPECGQKLVNKVGILL